MKPFLTKKAPSVESTAGVPPAPAPTTPASKVSFDAATAANNNRLEEIRNMPKKIFESNADALIDEIEKMRPRVRSGWINEQALVVLTKDGKVRKGLRKPGGGAWDLVLDVSAAAAVVNTVVFAFGGGSDFSEVSVAASTAQQKSEPNHYRPQ